VNENYYEVLGVGRKATPEEIRNHFRALVKKLHPDVNNGSRQGELKLKIVIEAYAVLSDPKRRKEYDRNVGRYLTPNQTDVSNTIRIVREPVHSTAFRSIGYDPYTQTMEIEFYRGGVFRYFEVPSDIYSELMKAEAKGEYYRANIASRFRERAMRR